MAGFITTQTVEENASLIIELWGRDFLTFAMKREGTTFLAALAEFGAIKAAA